MHERIMDYFCKNVASLSFPASIIYSISPLHANEKFFSENEQQQHQRVDLVISNVIRNLSTIFSK